VPSVEPSDNRRRCRAEDLIPTFPTGNPFMAGKCFGDWCIEMTIA
jgi:hypothetical protein